MKRQIRANKIQYQVLDDYDVELLKDAKFSANEYDEWYDWEQALDEIGHKHIPDPDEFEYYDLNNSQAVTIEKVDALIADILKNHFVYNITTDDDFDDDYDDDDYDEYDDDDYESYYVIKGLKYPTVSGSEFYSYVLEQFDTEEEAIDYAEQHSDQYPLSIWFVEGMTEESETHMWVKSYQ